MLGWPSFSGWSTVVSNTLETPIPVDNLTKSGTNGVSDDFGTTGSIRDQICYGNQYTMRVEFRQNHDDYVSYPPSCNTSITILDPCSISLPDGRTYDSSAGNLGLGGVSDTEDKFDPNSDNAILVQLKKSNDIGSVSFGFHFGSALFNQPGSIVLGGYEQNRVIGPVGLLDFHRHFPWIFLEDVTLGVEVGASPFKNASVGSVYQGIQGNEQAVSFASSLGARLNEAVIKINPAVPYIYLPYGTCETAASNLPVTWNSSLGLFIWNTEDPLFSRIVGSSAFLGFHFVDRNRMRFTVKVPFRVMNLTLTPPIVEKPTQYFPCKPSNNTEDEGTWQFGRAFLQAAFAGANYEQTTGFLAQAPGPDSEGSIVRDISPEASTIESSSIDWFQKSWDPFWTVLEEPGPETPSAYSAGAIGGIAAGSFVALLVIIFGVFLWRRNRRRSALPGSGSSKATLENPRYEGPAELGSPLPHQMPDVYKQTAELGDPLPHQMPDFHGRAELDTTIRYEMPVYDTGPAMMPVPSSTRAARSRIY